MLRILVVLSLVLCTFQAQAADWCLFLTEPGPTLGPTSRPIIQRRANYWWGSQKDVKLPFTDALRADLKRLGHLVVARAKITIHARYDTGHLDRLNASNLASLLGCRYALVGRLKLANRGQLSLLNQTAIHASISIEIIDIEKQKSLYTAKLKRWGFKKNPRVAASVAYRKLRSDIVTLTTNVLRKTYRLATSRHPLIHVLGLKSPSQIQNFRIGLQAAMPQIADLTLAGFSVGRATLRLRFKTSVKTFDDADFLTVELSKTIIPGIPFRVLRGKGREVWVQLVNQ